MRPASACANCGVATQVAGADLVEVEGVIDRVAQARGQVCQLAMIEHHGRREHHRDRVGDALAGDVGRRAVHGLEDGRVGPDVGARRHAEPADEAGHEVGQDVAEEVGGDDDIEAPRVEHELHRARIDDHRLHLDAALVAALVHLLGRLEEDAGERLHDVGLVHHRDLLAAGGDGVFEGILQQPAAALARVDAGGHRHSVRVVVDLHVVLVADVEAFQVLAHDHEVDVVVAAARNEGACRAQIRVELERLAQAHVRRTVAAAGRRLERALQRKARAANAVEHGRGQRVAGLLHAGQARDLAVPLEGGAERVEREQRGVDDLGTDAVAGNQRGGNACGHGRALVR
jgi:hypothetical protein